MPNLTLSQIFGQGVSTDIDPSQNKYQITLDLRDFQNTSEGGQIQNNLGISNLDTEAVHYQENGSKALNLLYAIVLLISQNQAANLNEDPEQKIFISQGGMNLGSGARAGQIRRVISLNLFSDAQIQDLPDIDSLGGESSDTGAL